MEKSIAKSPELLAQEERLKELLKQLKKARTSLKSLKTRLNNMKLKISDTQREVTNKHLRFQERLSTLYKEITELVEHCKTFKNLTEEDEEALDGIAGGLNQIDDELDLQGQEFEDYINSDAFESDHKERTKGIFNQFKVEPTEQEKRNIRKVFIRLSNQFHPDKARTEKDRQSYHTLMQEINEAYQANDIDKLLELEQVYINEETNIPSNSAVTIDLLDQNIKKIERDLAFIQSQSARTSQEIKTLRKSDMGQMLTEIKRMNNDGLELDEIFDQQDQSLDELEKMHVALKKCKANGNLDKLYEELDRFNEENRGAIEEFLDMMIGAEEWDDDDDDSWLNDDWDDDDEVLPEVKPVPLSKQKFPVGTSVKIKTDYYLDEKIPWNFLGEQGRIKEVLQIDSVIKYFVELDSKALKNIPSEIVDVLIELEIEFSVIELSTSSLKKSKARDKQVQTLSTYRNIMHKRIWSHLGEEKEKAMQDILLAHSTKSDAENWDDTLTKAIEFPTTFVTCSSFPLPPNTEVSVLKMAKYKEDIGHQVNIKYKGNAYVFPLKHLRSRQKGEKELLNLYTEWRKWRDNKFLDLFD